MKPLLLFPFLFVTLSCSKPTEEVLTEVAEGAYKVVVRSQEFNHSGIRSVDVCVGDVSSQFPTDKAQCFLHGFDFSGLVTRWVSTRDVDISFDCGRATQFSNFALVSKDHPLPVEFHATLNDHCSATPHRASISQ